jgi:hypothetical protein
VSFPKGARASELRSQAWFNRAPNLFRQHGIASAGRAFYDGQFLSIAAVSLIVLVTAISRGPCRVPALTD